MTIHTRLTRPRLAVAIATLLAAPLLAAEETQRLGDTVVTGTREAESLAETPASVGTIKGATIDQDKPTHPTDVMGQVPGVHINITNGEGHTTAIRQPLSTNPVYLFLEDGVPIRSTGFFNHNALYEINVPQAGGVEITRGPGTALYGSDAIGGIINVMTRTPPATGEVDVSGELGGWGWRRLLLGGGDSFGGDGVRGDLNLTHTDGWRDATAYDRQGLTTRWDHAFGAQGVAKTVLSYNHIDQETGANSPLVYADYRNHPTLNYYSIAYRKVDALRLSSALETEDGDTLVSIIPYVRDDSMELLPSFTLNFDPTVYTTFNKSVGVLSKWRRDFAPLRTRLIAGFDIDYSPGGQDENSIAVTSTGSGASRVFTGYTVGPRIYAYDASYLALSPYAHLEFSPAERWRVVAGLRYDHMSYDYHNQLASGALQVGSKFYGHADDTSLDFSHLSPKLGTTYALSERDSLFAAWNHGFRAPAQNQLFRPTSGSSAVIAQDNAQSALGLQPIRADQLEVGARGHEIGVDYSLSVYYLRKRDDIVTFRDPVTNMTQSMNAGETLHRGIETGLGIPLGHVLRLDMAFSYAEHTYESWTAVVSGANVNYSGKDMEFAPRWIANTRLTWLPTPNTRALLEWVSLGRYWMDAANTTEYEGYSLLNLRANWSITRRLALFGSVHNLTDVRYAESASITSSTPVYSPGLPRTLYAGVEYRWGGVDQPAAATTP